MKHPADLLVQASELFTERNSVYGDTWKDIGKTMQSLFPNGITLKTAEDFSRYASVQLCVIKIERYCVNFEKGGHIDSVRDLQVYAAILEAKTGG